MAHPSLRRRRCAVLSGALAIAMAVPALAPPATAVAAPSQAPQGTALRTSQSPQSSGGQDARRLDKVPTMTGGGGAVASVDQTASQVGIDVLRSGGNAIDAAVAMGATLGVTEPFSSGIAGGGFLVYYDARAKKVTTIDGRETAPATFNAATFTKPDGTAMDFATAMTSGLSVGVPGTPALWQKAIDEYGTRSLGQLLYPAQRVATRGFVVDGEFRKQVLENADRFRTFPASSRLWLPGGDAPAVGSVFRNPDLARSYGELRRAGTRSLYGGRLGRAIVDEARNPDTAPGKSVYRGQITLADLRDYRAVVRKPVASTYRGLSVYGMPVPSSGGIAVAEVLNLLEAYERATGESTSSVAPAQWYHRFAEASATAFADRNRYVGHVPGVPVAELTSKAFAAERACGFNAGKAQPRPIAFGSPDGSYGGCQRTAGEPARVNDGRSTTSLSVVDKWGNTVAYTLTIEAWGGSGITVPGWGLLLNNELTDFNFTPSTPGVPDPNLPAAGKRPRSSMSPTVILKDGRPYLSVGAPGGATIITTVSQIVTGYVDRGMPLVDAIAAPRISSRNTAATAEPALINSAVGAQLKRWGQPMTSADEIGRAAAVTVDGRRFTAAAETTRAGGGSAMVVEPTHN